MVEIVIVFLWVTTYIMALHVHTKRADYETHKSEYHIAAALTGIMWPVTFVPVLREFWRVTR